MSTTAAGAASIDVALEPRRDLVAALAVDAAVEHLPVGMRLHQPVGVLAASRRRARRRRLERRLEPRRARGRRVAQRDDADRGCICRLEVPCRCDRSAACCAHGAHLREQHRRGGRAPPAASADTASASRITRRMFRPRIFLTSSSV